MSDDEKKINEEAEGAAVEGAPSENAAATGLGASAGGGLPGLGAKPAGGGLPGLGAKPAGGGLPGLGGGAPAGGGLPGLGGGAPAGGGLPGLGAKPAGGAPAGGGLPGLGGGAPAGGGLPGVGGGAPAAGGAGGAVPDFIKKKQEEERQAAMARDPFAATNLPPQRSSFVPDGANDIPEDSGPPVDTSALGGNRKMVIVVTSLIALLTMGGGFALGSAIAQRGLLNKVLADAWIIQFEMKKLRGIHGEVSGMVNTALTEARQKKFNKDHAAFLMEKVPGNPFDARLFTDRNYKNLSPMVVQMMASLYRDWETLAQMIAEHNAAINADKKALTAAGDEFKKLMTTSYGAIFGRNEKAGNQLVANIVVLSGSEGDTITIQQKPGGQSSERKLYNPEGADSKLTESPSEYVIPVDQMSKASVLQNATQSHFIQYTKRLTDMSKLLKEMEEKQKNMFGPLNDNCSREPVSFASGDDPEVAFEEYKAKQKK